MPRDEDNMDQHRLLERQTRKRLIELARAAGISGVSKMRKAELVEALLRLPQPLQFASCPGEGEEPRMHPPNFSVLFDACLRYAELDKRVFVAPAIPRRRLGAAVSAMRVPPAERLLALIDNTPGGGGAFGLLIAASGLYWRNVRNGLGDAADGYLSWRALSRLPLRLDGGLGDVYAGPHRINAQRLCAAALFALLQDAQTLSRQSRSSLTSAATIPTCKLEQAHLLMKRKPLPAEATALLASLLTLGQDHAREAEQLTTVIVGALNLTPALWSKALTEAQHQRDPLALAKRAMNTHGARALIWECLLALRQSPPGDSRAQEGLARVAVACGVSEAEIAQAGEVLHQHDASGLPWLNARAYLPGEGRFRMGATPAPQAALLPAEAAAGLVRALVYLGAGESMPVARRSVRTPAGTLRTFSTLERDARSLSTRTEFSFEPLGGSGQRLCLAVSGYLSADADNALDWGPLRHFALGAECYALRWESQAVRALSSQLVNLSLRSAGRALFHQVTQRPVTLAAPGAALPGLVLEYAHSVDQSWREAVQSSDATAQRLANHLRQSVPRGQAISLVGFSLGSRVIFRTLEELARTRDQGIVDEVILMGGAFSASENRWRSVRSVVSGRFVNAYCKSDYILRYLYRAAEWEKQIAGLLPAQASGIKDVDLTEIAQGHLGYRKHLRRIMQRIFGEST